MAVDTDYSLVTLVELKDFLAGEDNDYPVDVDMEPSLETTINGVSRWMHEYTGRQLKSREITRYHSGDGTTNLYVHSWPVSAIKVYVDQEFAFGAETEITPDLTEGNLVYYSGTYPSGTKNVKIVYTAGYVTIPGDLKLACLHAYQVIDRVQKQGISGVGQVSIAGTNIQLHVEKLASPFVLDVLNRYRRAFL